jgi:predicted Fe-Mo cluster-binding NifX family protein
MKIVITSTGMDLDSTFSPTFGRCPVFVFFETQSEKVEPVRNPASQAQGGAGIQAAKFIIDKGAETIVTGRVGPKAMDVLQATGIPIYLFQGNSVRQAIEAFKKGELMQEKN